LHRNKLSVDRRVTDGSGTGYFRWDKVVRKDTAQRKANPEDSWDPNRSQPRQERRTSGSTARRQKRFNRGGWEDRASTPSSDQEYFLGPSLGPSHIQPPVAITQDHRCSGCLLSDALKSLLLLKVWP
jgi:hypothetical protein